MADPLKDLGFEDETEALKGLGFEEETPLRQDWGDAGARAPDELPGPESLAPEPYGPRENPLKDPGKLTSLGHALESGFWKQGSDEAIGAITAAVQAPGNGARWKMPDGTVRPLETRGDVYRAGRDTERQTLSAARETHPVLSFVGNATGDIASDMVLKQFGVPVNSQAYQMASGAITGLMGNEADLTQPTPEALRSAADSAAAGAAIGYAAPKVGQWVGRQVGRVADKVGEAAGSWWEGSAVQDWLEQRARERALKAAGYIQKDFPREAAKKARLLEQGQRLLDEPGLITPGSTSETIADRLEPLVQREGQKIGQYLSDADAAGAASRWVGTAADDAPIPVGSEFNPYTFLQRAQEEVLEPASLDPALASQTRTIRNLLTGYRKTAAELASRGQPFPLQLANEMKGNLQAAVFNNRGDIAKNKELVNALQRIFTEEIDSQFEQMAGQEARVGFSEAKRNYGAFKGAFDKATQGANRETGNQLLSLKDMQAAQATAAAGGGIIAPAVALASKLVRGRADSTAARLADALARSGSTAQALGQAAPGALGAVGAAVARPLASATQAATPTQRPSELPDGDFVSHLLQQNPEKLGRFGPDLQRAAQEGRLSVVHYVLSQKDPEYRAMLEQARKEAE